MSFKRDGSAREIPTINKPKTADDTLWANLEKLRTEHNHLVRTFNGNLTKLERTSGQGVVTVITTDDAAGTGGTTSFSEYQRKTTTVFAGFNTITFASPMSSSSYTLYINIRNANGEKILYREVERRTNGFDIADVYETGTLECLAVL